MAKKPPRRALALTAPDATAALATFPKKTLRAQRTFYRQHRDRPAAGGADDRGAWYYAAHEVGVVGNGRFDLGKPHGTCYLSSSEVGAVNELVGPDHATRGWVDADLLAGRVLSTLQLPHDVRAADTTSARATTFRVTNEMASTDRYDITQAWAHSFHEAGFGGVFHLLRFSPGSARGLAVFGTAGPAAPTHPGDPRPQPLRALVESLGVEVVDPPSLSAVNIVPA